MDISFIKDNKELIVENEKKRFNDTQNVTLLYKSYSHSFMI